MVKQKLLLSCHWCLINSFQHSSELSQHLVFDVRVVLVSSVAQETRPLGEFLMISACFNQL